MKKISYTYKESPGYRTSPDIQCNQRNIVSTGECKSCPNFLGVGGKTRLDKETVKGTIFCVDKPLITD
jgi:hypothetical protein